MMSPDENTLRDVAKDLVFGWLARHPLPDDVLPETFPKSELIRCGFPVSDDVEVIVRFRPHTERPDVITGIAMYDENITGAAV